MLWGAQKKWKTQSLPAVLLSRSGCITRRGDDRSVYPIPREWLGIPLLHFSGTPDIHPLPAPPSLGDLQSHGWGKEGGGEETDEGTSLSQTLYDRTHAKPWGGESWGPDDLPVPVGTSSVQGAVLTDVKWFLAFPLSPFSGDPTGPVSWRF